MKTPIKPVPCMIILNPKSTQKNPKTHLTNTNALLLNLKTTPTTNVSPSIQESSQINPSIIHKVPNHTVHIQTMIKTLALKKNNELKSARSPTKTIERP
jgi:hypothetical protein